MTNRNCRSKSSVESVLALVGETCVTWLWHWAPSFSPPSKTEVSICVKCSIAVHCCSPGTSPESIAVVASVLPRSTPNCQTEPIPTPSTTEHSPNWTLVDSSRTGVDIQCHASECSTLWDPILQVLLLQRSLLVVWMTIRTLMSCDDYDDDAGWWMIWVPWWTRSLPKPWYAQTWTISQWWSSRSWLDVSALVRAQWLQYQSSTAQWESTVPQIWSTLLLWTTVDHS